MELMELMGMIANDGEMNERMKPKITNFVLADMLVTVLTCRWTFGLELRTVTFLVRRWGLQYTSTSLQLKLWMTRITRQIWKKVI